jgi:hypothetical protein
MFTPLYNTQPFNTSYEEYKKVTDAGTALDVLSSMGALFSLVDSSTGQESLSASFAFFLTDSGTGTDSISSPRVFMNPVDTGVGVELTRTEHGTITVPDSGLGEELSKVLADLNLSDSGISASELIGILAHISLEEQVQVPLYFFGAAFGESLYNEGTIAIVRRFRAGEETYISTIIPTQIDSGIGLDKLALEIYFLLREAGLGAEVESVEIAPFTLIDSGNSQEFIRAREWISRLISQPHRRQELVAQLRRLQEVLRGKVKL